MAVAVAVAVAVSGGGAVAVAVAVAGLTKRFFNHIQKDFLINVWGYCRGRTFLYFCFFSSAPCGTAALGLMSLGQATLPIGVIYLIYPRTQSNPLS